MTTAQKMMSMAVNQLTFKLRHTTATLYKLVVASISYLVTTYYYNRYKYASITAASRAPTIRFKKYVLLMSLISLTSIIYLNLAFADLNYLNTPINVNTEDVTGVSKLSQAQQQQLSFSRFPPLGSLSTTTTTTASTTFDSLLTLPNIKYNYNSNNNFDPRLMPALALAKITSLLQSNNLDPEAFQLPFSWNDWLDLDSKLKASHKWYNYFNRHDFTCESFKKYYQVDSEFGVCVPLKSKDLEPGFPQFKIKNWDDSRFQQEARAIMGASYLKFQMTPPDRVIFLGVDDQDDGGALVIPTLKNRKTGQAIPVSRNQSIVQSLEYIEHELSINEGLSRESIIAKGINIADQAKNFASTLKNMSTSSKNSMFKIDEDDFDIPIDVVRIINHGADHRNQGLELQLTKNEFLWKTEGILEELKKRTAAAKGKKNVNNLDYKLLKQMSRLHSNGDDFPKHFHESAIVGRPVAGAHYDWRFFNKLDLPYYEHVAILHRLIRAWLRFSRVAGINTWIAHGTMLSWYWNGLNMPWDTDADVQVPVHSLYKLARSYDRSLITDLTMSTDDPFQQSANIGVGKFYLDVGASFFSRTKGNGNNAIDARLIDTKTGLYIDITGLAFTNFYENPDLQGDTYQSFLKVLDSNFTNKINDPATDREAYDKELLTKKRQAFDNKEIFNCRNNHHYSLQELSPLIPTLYEGALAYVPHGFSQMLPREYSKGMNNTRFWGHSFRPNLRLWIKNEVCPKDLKGDHCDDLVTLAEYKQTQHYTALHEDEMKLIVEMGEHFAYTPKDEFPPLRIDPWFIRHTKRMLGLLSNTVDYDNAA